MVRALGAGRVTPPTIGGLRAQRIFVQWVERYGVEVPARGGYRFNRARWPEGFIYFAIGETGPLKIGWSRNPLRRVKELGLCPIVFVSRQSIYDELNLHRRLRLFAEGHSTKRPNRAPEWFRRSSPVLSLAYMLANAAPHVAVLRAA